MRGVVIAAALPAIALALGCRGPDSAAATEALRLHATPVEIAPAELDGLVPVSAFELSADHPEFGGLSGLLVEDGRLTAVTDMGWLLTAGLAGIGSGTADFRPLPGESGSGDKSASDAESLARHGNRLAIGFERDHRIELVEDGRIATEIRQGGFERLASNSGLEALVRLPDGGLLAIGEMPLGGSFPVFVVRPDGRVETGELPQAGHHAVTGADIGPDGRLYLLRRDSSIIAGVSARIERYALDPSGFPRPETRETLARFENDSGIDNMEGIAVWAEPDGQARMAIVSDDNFNPLQRTLLLLFDIED